MFTADKKLESQKYIWGNILKYTQRNWFRINAVSYSTESLKVEKNHHIEEGVCVGGNNRKKKWLLSPLTKASFGCQSIEGLRRRCYLWNWSQLKSVWVCALAHSSSGPVRGGFEFSVIAPAPVWKGLALFLFLIFTLTFSSKQSLTSAVSLVNSFQCSGLFPTTW